MFLNPSCDSHLKRGKWKLTPYNFNAFLTISPRKSSFFNTDCEKSFIFENKFKLEAWPNCGQGRCMHLRSDPVVQSEHPCLSAQ